jgi:hypothetical protein
MTWASIDDDQLRSLRTKWECDESDVRLWILRPPEVESGPTQLVGFS